VYLAGDSRGLVGVQRQWIIKIESGKSTAEVGLVLRTERRQGVWAGAARLRASNTAFAIMVASVSPLHRKIDAMMRFCANRKTLRRVRPGWPGSIP